MEECVFCNVIYDVGDNGFAASSETMVAIPDKFPVTPLHHLIIPRDHRKDFFALSQIEVLDLRRLLHKLKNQLIEQDSTITGFNIGMNCGADAGQTVSHCHAYLIPRRKGDNEDPKVVCAV